jgi:AraC-like DNA-binding protein
MVLIPRFVGEITVDIVREPGECSKTVHGHHVISCHTRGHGFYICGAERFEALPVPFMGLLARGEPDINGLIGRMDGVYCMFDGDVVQPDVGARARIVVDGTAIERSHLRALTMDELPHVLERFAELKQWTGRPDPASRLRGAAVLTELLALWAQGSSAVAREDRAVRDYRDLIERHALDPGVSLEQLARRIGMSEDHLRVRFTREMGMPPVAYRTQLRLRRSRELLAASTVGVAAIAAKVGFPNAAYFSRLFRSHFKLSPIQFARAARMGTATR